MIFDRNRIIVEEYIVKLEMWVFYIGKVLEW